MKLSKEKAINVVWEDHEDWKSISETMVDQRRWETDYEGIFQHIPTGKYYSVDYSKGSTECQETELFYTDEVEFQEVELKEVTVKQWVKVPSPIRKVE